MPNSYDDSQSTPAAVSKDVEPLTSVTFPVVGIGASAGGLEAFLALLGPLKADTGMAFVLIQHLDPAHESRLSEILARATPMPVEDVTDGMVIAPNQVYVMPANARITVAEGKLKLAPRPSGNAAHFPIDEFFESLATALKENAIGVVLSGTGSDGAKGLAAVMAEGGITFAQDRQSAKFDGMPAAAIASGVDFVLPPAEIAEELMVLSNMPIIRPRPRAATQPGQRHPLDALQGGFGKILSLLQTGKGMDLSHYKLPTVQRRVARRMLMHGLANVDDYGAYLASHPTELGALYEDILIKVTCFFRSPESFEALRDLVFPAIVAGKSGSAAIRIWVPGCATGEEAYSIAICLHEFMEETGKLAKVEIFATDVSEVALAKARSGYYDASIAEHVSPERLGRFFIRDGGGYRVNAAIREDCVFARQNVVRDPPFSRMDLISCRNLLIYFTPRAQKSILAAFHFGLSPGGFLMLGSAETTGLASDRFSVLDKANKIYARLPGSRGAFIPDFALDALGRRGSVDVPFALPRMTAAAKRSIKDDAEQAILARFVPPGVVVNDRMDVLQFRGDTSPYLIHPPGEVTANLLKMCREGLLVELHGAIQAAAAGEVPVKKDGWMRTAGGQSTPITIDVIPFTASETDQRHFAVLFGTRPSAEPALGLTDDARTAVLQCERELAETKEYLNAVIEKEQASNEELNAASEELLSANEELQSTNEEMATAKEEIQAANEELTTINDELQSRNQELGRVSSDLTNLIGSIQIPLVVLLGGDLTVRRFTSSAEKFLNLTAADVGRPLADLATKIGINGLLETVTEVTTSLETKDQEVCDRGGHWYSLRVSPYRTADNKLEGAVLALVDIDDLKRSYSRLSEAYDYAEAIVQTTPVPLLVLDEGLRVTSANQAFYRDFQVPPADTIGQRIYDLGSGQWNAPDLRTLLEDLLPKNERIESYVVDHEFPSLGRRTMRLSARRLLQPDKKAAKILLAINDVTAEVHAAEDIREAKAAAEQANQAKSNFLANMSHEMRTPLGSILGFAELLANREQTREEALECTTRIRRNVEHLTELIDEILDLAKIEAGRLEVDRVRVALLPELAETVALMQGQADAKGLALNVIFDGKIPEVVTVCPRRLRQILVNVVGNALKFTDQGHVDLVVGLAPPSGAADAVKLRFVVTDTGCGLSEEQQSRIFQPFGQADSTITRRFGGTGLGLALARRLAQALGGDVVLTESQAGKGSTFTITVDPGPLAGVPMLEGLSKAALASRKKPVADYFVRNQRLAGLTVLLVEDGPDMRELMAHLLKASGATVELAGNGAEAVERALSRRFSVVLMDIQMPVLDGYEATKRLRAAGCQVPIVALTAHAMHGERERCLAAGCDDYVSKPVKPNDLIAVVERVSKTGSR